MIVAEPNRWYMHVKTGMYYFLHAIGKIEATLEEVAVYRSRSTGAYWVRPIAEFSDGRFEIVEPEITGNISFKLSDKELRKLADDIMDGSMS